MSPSKQKFKCLEEYILEVWNCFCADIDCKHIKRSSVQQKSYTSYNATQQPYKSWVSLPWILEVARGLSLSPEVRLYENRYIAPTPKADIYQLQAHSFGIWSTNRTTCLRCIEFNLELIKKKQKQERRNGRFLASLKNQ